MTEEPAPYVVFIEPDFSNIVTGIWCDEHHLPHKIRIPLTMLTRNSVSTGNFQEVCDDGRGD